MWIDHFKWAKGVKILVSHVNAHPKVTTERSNEVDRMTCSVDSQPLSQAIPAITQWAHEQSSHGSRDGVLHGLSNIDFPSPRLVEQQLWLSVRSSISRDQP